MRAEGLDIFAADSYASRYSQPRPGPKPRPDAPVLGRTDELAAILRRMRDTATPPTVQA